MSGHSKWSKVKHQKAVTDAVKGREFTKASHAITIAVKEGGGNTDPNFNFKLRLAIEKARAVNMPKENIERAIAKGKGEDINSIENVTYEGFGPGGVAMVIEATTDNKQRTVSQIKNLLDRAGGRLGGPGSVSYLFRQTGVITVPKAGSESDKVYASAIESGADDVTETDDYFEIYTAPGLLHHVRDKMGEQGINIDNADIVMSPVTTVEATPDFTEKINNLVETLEESEDVQSVYTNLA